MTLYTPVLWFYVVMVSLVDQGSLSASQPVRPKQPRV